MALRKRLSRKQISKDFDHYGLMYGIVPVYIGDPYGEARIATRNWCPEFALDLADGVFSLASSFMVLINPQFEPLFFFSLTGQIAKK